MTRLNKRAFLKAASLPLAASLGLSARPANAAEFTLKCSHVLPATHPTHLRLVEAGEQIRKETKGRVELQAFSSGQLGTDMDQLSQLRAGALDFFSLSPLVLGSLIPTAQITGIAFGFSNYDSVWAAMDGGLGEWVRKEIQKSSLFALETIWDNGFRQMTSGRKPIHTPADLADFKMRVAVSPIFTSVFKGLGASPVSVNFTEVYSALQTHIADGMENSLSLLHTAKIYEVQKFCAMTNHMWDGFWMLGNQRNFARLPGELQQIVRRRLNEAGLKQRADVRKLNDGLVGELTAKGMQFNDTKNRQFRDKLRAAGFYQEWRSKFGAEGWGLLEKYAGSLA
jgi:tripartite ATP-independent transporter DctP family solute receptor